MKMNFSFVLTFVECSPIVTVNNEFIPVVTLWNISYFICCWFEPMLGVVYRHVPGINTPELGPYQSLRRWGNISLIGYTSLLRTWGDTSLVPVLYQSQYQVYTCFMPNQKSGLDPIPRTRLVWKFKKSPQYQYQPFVLKRKNLVPRGSWYVQNLIPSEDWFELMLGRFIDGALVYKLKLVLIWRNWPDFYHVVIVFLWDFCYPIWWVQRYPCWYLGASYINILNIIVSWWLQHKLYYF